MGHAQLSPSAWERWSSCPGSVALCRDLPDTSGAHADEGTAAHEMAELILRGQHHKLHDSEGKFTKAQNGVAFTAEMLEYVGRYTNTVVEIAANNAGELHVEQRLPIWHWTGEPGAHGTSDAVILLADELVVADLKYGRGVEVEAEGNGQLMIYALASLCKFGGEVDKDMAELTGEPWCGDRFKRVRLCISQPRLGHWKEHTLTVGELLAFGEQVKAASERTRTETDKLNPSPKGCRWCKAKATCPAAAAQVEDIVFEGSASDFQDIIGPGAKLPPVPQLEPSADPLARALKMADFIEAWAKAVRAEAERRLLAGVPVQGYKLVQGRAGNRAWTDASEAEALLKHFRLKPGQMYDFKLISPTKAAKLMEGDDPVIGPRQAKKLQALIHRPEGSLSVAPATDPRPAVDVAPTGDDVSDLL